MDSIFTAQYSCLLTTSSSLFILLLLLHFSQTTTSQHCPPSSCGIISNISYPFRLKGDPKHCRRRGFELACEDNVTSIYLDSHKYYRKYTSTIRVVDSSINNVDICSFTAFSASLIKFTISGNDRLYNYNYHINLMSCPNPLKNSSTLFTNVTDCASSSNSSASHGYDYIKVGYINAPEVPEMCTLEKIVATSASFEFKDLNSTVSLSEIHDSLLYGFEVPVCTECITGYAKWDEFLLFKNNGILLVPLAILVFLVAGVSLPVTIIIALTGVYLLSFKFIPAFEITVPWAVNLNYYFDIGGLSFESNFLLLGLLLICLANVVFFTAAAKLLAVIIMGFTGVVAVSVQLLNTRSTDVYTVAKRTLLSAALSDIIILAPRIVIGLCTTE